MILENFNNRKCAPELVFFNEKNEKDSNIDFESQKSNFGTF